MFTDVDRSLWYDLIEELRERYQTTPLRRAPGETGERCTSQGERSNSEGERSSSARERGKSSGAGAA